MVLLTLIFFGGPLFIFFVKRQVPVLRDWSGRARGGMATPGDTPYDGDYDG